MKGTVVERKDGNIESLKKKVPSGAFDQPTVNRLHCAMLFGREKVRPLH